MEMVPSNRCVALTLLLAGCGGQTEGHTPTTLVENAVGASVSFDGTFIAYYVQPSRLSAGPFSGSLEVMPLPSGSAISLGDGAIGANFGASVGTLYFLQRPTMDATTSEYTGTFSIWTPKLDVPVALSSGYVPRSVTTADHSVILFLDTPQPDQAAPGQVKLLQTGECAGTSCPVQTLADGVALTAERMSPDGRYAAYDTETLADGGEEREIFLVSVADATTTQVATTTIPARVVSVQELSSFAPDGSLLATLTTIDGNALQLQVISTATGAPIPWATPPGTFSTNVQFADPATLLVGVLDAQGISSVYRTTATEASLLVNATQFFLSYVPAGAERYLFFTTTTTTTALASNAPYDLQMLDLSAPTAPPVTLAQSTRSVPSVSNDLSAAWFIDPYDAATGLGTLIAASLPGGRLSTVASSANFSGGENFGGDTSHLFYFGTPSFSSSVPNAAGAALYDFIQGASEQVDPDALRWDSDSTPTIYVTANNPLRIYREPLP
jgi:hypothetical protein